MVLPIAAGRTYLPTLQTQFHELGIGATGIIIQNKSQLPQGYALLMGGNNQSGHFSLLYTSLVSFK